MSRFRATYKQNDCFSIEENKLEDATKRLNRVDANLAEKRDYNFVNFCKLRVIKNHQVLGKCNDVAVKGMNVFGFNLILIFLIKFNAFLRALFFK